ncbi:MAG TPA: gephyrin-like molybdotransferase Glp, partial [Anaerolineales bacterium]|nr:gephyrin-like molybdotransferase Glp [Anaerolineales bacterium]
MTLLSVEAAQRRILRLFRPVDTETVPLARALGRVLAAEIRSISLPPFDNSSVDGFALRSADVQTASTRRPVRLHVVADIAAGSTPSRALRPGQTARIMTGAELPRGADSVAMLESSDHARAARGAPPPTAVRIFKSTAAGENVRYRGSDADAGTIALRTGTVLRPQELGLLAMLGKPNVRVHRRPRVAVLSSGNELLPPSRSLQRGAIRDTNSVTLASLAAQSGCDVIRLGIARDTKKSIEARLRSAVVRRVDLIITSAGVSVGALDLVRDVVRAHGRLIFWRVNVRPGKPLAVGEYEGIPLIGLPGNPVSAFVGFELF